MNIIEQLERDEVARLGKQIPDFEAGDTVQVNVKVVEGDRSRIQAYEGVCIGRSCIGRGNSQQGGEILARHTPRGMPESGP